MRSRILFGICFVSVLVGQPSFTAHSLGTSEYIQSLLPADMDNDGDIDLLAARWTEGSAVVWYENNGSESFTMQTVSANHGYVQTAIPIDLDQDGDNEIIFGDLASNGVIHVLNDDGTEIFSDIFPSFPRHEKMGTNQYNPQFQKEDNHEKSGYLVYLAPESDTLSSQSDIYGFGILPKLGVFSQL